MQEERAEAGQQNVGEGGPSALRGDERTESLQNSPACSSSLFSREEEADTFSESREVTEAAVFRVGGGGCDAGCEECAEKLARARGG